MHQDRRPAPMAPKPWYRRYGPAIFVTGLLLAVTGFIVSFAFVANEAAQAYGGGFDQATWQEPQLASALGLGVPTTGPLGIPLPGQDSVDVTRTTPSGTVAWTLDKDGTVTMRPVDETTLWPDAKAAFEAWADDAGLPAPSYSGIQLTAEGEQVPAEQLLA